MSVKKSYRLPFWRRGLMRPVFRQVFRWIFHILSPVEISGIENIPKGKPYIVAINHVSLFEAPFICAFWPRQLEVIGASDIWERPGQNVLVKMWGVIPVHRGGYDRSAIESVLLAINSGFPLLIAPEGGRSHTPGIKQARPGIAFIIERTRVPVIPVGIVGTTSDYWHKASEWKRPKLEMHVGKPIEFSQEDLIAMEKKVMRQKTSDLVMRYVAGLLPGEYRGYYAESAIFQ